MEPPTRQVPLPLAQPDPGKGRTRRWRALWMHLSRVALLAGIVLLVRRQHAYQQAQRAGEASSPVAIGQLQRFFPAAAALSDWDPISGGRNVEDESGRVLGYYVLTSPESDAIVGFSGPTNSLLAFDADNRVVGVSVLSTGDTPEHLRHAESDPRFLSSYLGLTWEEAVRLPATDGVSGATLTSLAIREGIALRLGGVQPSSRFPEPLALAEVQRFLPSARALRPPRDSASMAIVLADHDPESGRDQELGFVLRTTPSADQVIGYQGPTDTLLVTDRDRRLVGAAIRRSFDNQPYVRYVEEDEYFFAWFRGRTLGELAKLKLQEEEMDGVSGATMTSMAIAEGIVKTSRSSLAAQSDAEARRADREGSMSITVRDLASFVLLALAVLMAFTRVRQRKRLRLLFRVALIAILGFLNCDLLSQAQLLGWVQHGIPWSVAPRLVVLTAAALLIPLLTGRPYYCHHVCPFGAVQALLPRPPRAGKRFSRRTVKWLKRLPAVLLAAVLCTALFDWPINLASIEPFEAFAFWVAPAATVFLAVAALLFSLFLPMGYCRLGCPTGALLSYLRFSATAHRVTSRDLFAWAMLLLAAAFTLL